MKKLLTIGNTAAELGMPASAIRFYEKNGLVPNQQHSSDGQRLFDEDVKKLTVYRGQRVDYYEVLRCYLEHNMSLLHTSEALFVHRTTPFNYLKGIRSSVKANLNDPASRLRIIASYQIMDLDAQDRRHVPRYKATSA